MMSLQALKLYLAKSQTTAVGTMKFVMLVHKVKLYNSTCLLFCASARLGLSCESITGIALAYVRNTVKNIVI
jgi:hypothetical protein